MIVFLVVFLNIFLSNGYSYASTLEPKSCTNIPQSTLLENSDIVFMGHLIETKCSCKNVTFKCTKEIKVTNPIKNSKKDKTYKIDYNLTIDYGCSKQEAERFSNSKPSNTPKTYYLKNNFWKYKELNQVICISK
jgi:hypothetical protein